MRVIIYVTLVISLLSCDNKNKEVEQTVNVFTSNSIKDSLFGLQIDLFYKRYNALTNWDTIPYTYKMIDYIDSIGGIVGVEGEVVDINRSKDNFIITISSYQEGHKCLFDLRITAAEYHHQYNTINSMDNDMCFVVKIDTLKKYTPQLSSESEACTGEGDEPNSYIKIDAGGSLLYFKGELIDCIAQNQFPQFKRD